MKHQTLWRAMFVLALLLFALLAASALAEEPSIVASGECGDSGANLTWQLDSAGTLTISGTGGMRDRPGDQWYNQRALIHNVIVQEGVTGIGSFAFEACGNLTNISLPQGLTSIGELAFYGCSGLTSISLPDSTLPDGVISIGQAAFAECSSLTSVSLPRGLIGIESSTFSGCSSLTSIILPEGVTSIDTNAFYRCSSLTSVTLPDSLTSIAYGAFQECSSLTSITLPGVTSIGGYAFFRCSSLASVSLSENIAEIGTLAFNGCDVLQRVLFRGSQMPELGELPFLDTPDFTVYCYRLSAVDKWATDEEYPIVYLDNLDMSKPWELSLPEDCRLAVGKSMRIALSMFPVLENASVHWSSSAPEIVSVEYGVATAHAAGTATITATCDDLRDTMEIRSYTPATDFALSAEEIWVAAEDTARLSILDMHPEGAEGDFVLSASYANILDLSQSGNEIRIDAKSIGDVTVSVRETNSGFVRECLVHVSYPVTAVEFDAAAQTLAPDGEAQLTANVTTYSESFVNKLVSFSSSDERVATVDANGRVRARGTGTATITATAGSGASASCMIIVIGGDTFTLPAETKCIKAEAFEGTKIERVILPDGCAEIGARAFANNARLAVINMPDSIASIAEDAFQGCANVVFLCESQNTAAAFAEAHGIPWCIDDRR